MSKHYDIEQGTPEWHLLRLGKVTGSRASKLMSKGRGSAPSVTRADLIASLALQRITGTPEGESYSSPAMRRGTELEPQARDEYVFQNIVHVDVPAFVDHYEFDFAGYSPDGLVGDKGGIEIKCYASPAKHLKALERKQHHLEYKWQVAMYFECMPAREWLDFVSYEPNFPEELRLATRRVTRAEMAEEIDALHKGLMAGELDIFDTMKSITDMQKAA